MKKVLLMILGFGAISASAQTFTADDTLSSGDSQFFWTADSSASNLDATTGSGVTWDYSTLEGYPSLTNVDTIKNASDSPDFGDFSSADYWDDLSGGASIYFANLPDSVMSYGFKFTLGGNSVKVMHDVDPMKMMELPMTLNDTYTDSTYGTAEVYGESGDTEGDVVVIVDGHGTLNLGDSVFTDVIRIKTVETIATTLVLPPPINQVSGIVTRTEYRYFKLADQNMPLMVHGSVSVASNLFNGGYSAVYSSVELADIAASIGEEEIKGFSVYPNPANSIVNVVTENVDEVRVTNALGQTVHVITKPKATESIDVSTFETGVYFIQVSKGNASRTEKLFVK